MDRHKRKGVKQVETQNFQLVGLYGSTSDESCAVLPAIFHNHQQLRYFLADGFILPLDIEGPLNEPRVLYSIYDGTLVALSDSFISNSVAQLIADQRISLLPFIAHQGAYTHALCASSLVLELESSTEYRAVIHKALPYKAYKIWMFLERLQFNLRTLFALGTEAELKKVKSCLLIALLIPRPEMPKELRIKAALAALSIDSTSDVAWAILYQEHPDRERILTDFCASTKRNSDASVRQRWVDFLVDIHERWQRSWRLPVPYTGYVNLPPPRQP